MPPPPPSTLFPYTTLFRSHLLLTRYSPERVEKGDMLSIADVEEILGLKVIGVIPEAPEVLQSSNAGVPVIDRKSTRLNSSHVEISYAVFCLKKKTINHTAG